MLIVHPRHQRPTAAVDANGLSPRAGGGTDRLDQVVLDQHGGLAGKAVGLAVEDSDVVEQNLGRWLSGLLGGGDAGQHQRGDEGEKHFLDLHGLVSSSVDQSVFL